MKYGVGMALDAVLTSLWFHQVKICAVINDKYTSEAKQQEFAQ